MTNKPRNKYTAPFRRNHTSVSTWIIAGIFALWTSGCSDSNSAGQQTLTDDAERVKQREVAATLSSTEYSGSSTTAVTAKKNDIKIAAIDGGSIYATQCQACHQAGGTGITGVFPPLKDADWVTGDPSVLTGIILAGYIGSLEVLGKTYNGAMPAFADKLTNEEAAALATYLRTKLNNGTAVDTDLVRRVRSQIPSSPYTSLEDLNALAKP